MFSSERSSSEPRVPRESGDKEGYERKYSVKDGAERAHRRTESPVGGPHDHERPVPWLRPTCLEKCMRMHGKGDVATRENRFSEKVFISFLSQERAREQEQACRLQVCTVSHN